MDDLHPELEELFERYRKAPEGYAFVPLADACRKVGNLVEALEICEKGIAIHPTYVSGHVVRGKCFYDKGDRDMAMGTFERVLDLDPGNLVALKFLGMMEAEDGDFELARRHLEQILVLDPENKDVVKTVRMIDEQIQGQQAWDDAARQTATEKHDDVEMDDDEAPVALSGRMDDDLDMGPSESSDRAPILTSDDIETSDELATITLAEIFASQGYVDKARTIYKELEKRNPDNALIKEKLSALPAEPGEAVEEDVEKPVEPPVVDEDASNATVAFSELSESRPQPGQIPGESHDPIGVTVSPEPEPDRKKPTRPIDEKDSMRRFRRWLGDMGN